VLYSTTSSTSTTSTSSTSIPVVQCDGCSGTNAYSWECQGASPSCDYNPCYCDSGSVVSGSCTNTGTCYYG
jgi:hypothetical protein